MCFAFLAVLLALPSFIPQQNSAPGPQNKVAHPADNSTLYEAGAATRLRKPPPPGEFRVVSYNIRWRSGDELQKLIKLFREDEQIGNATVLALQEVDRNKERSGRTNTAKLLAEELGLYYVW